MSENGQKMRKDASSSFPLTDPAVLEERMEAAGKWFEGQRPLLNGTFEVSDRLLADEVPVTLRYNGAFEHGTMMLTPLDLKDFALGISLSERIISSPASLKQVEIVSKGESITLEMEIGLPDFRRLLRGSSRASVAGSACGLCGSRDEALFDSSLPCLAFDPSERGAYRLPVIEAVIASLRQAQALNQKIGMLHAAFWADKAGNILFVREDIGRHNALDKLIGALKYADMEMSAGFCALTSRCSYEMAQKAVLAGMRCLVAVSAPSAYAVRLARQAGLTLMAPAVGEKKMIFSVPERLSL